MLRFCCSTAFAQASMLAKLARSSCTLLTLPCMTGSVTVSKTYAPHGRPLHPPRSIRAGAVALQDCTWLMDWATLSPADLFLLVKMTSQPAAARAFTVSSPSPALPPVQLEHFSTLGRTRSACGHVNKGMHRSNLKPWHLKTLTTITLRVTINCTRPAACIQLTVLSSSDGRSVYRIVALLTQGCCWPNTTAAMSRYIGHLSATQVCQTGHDHGRPPWPCCLPRIEAPCECQPACLLKWNCSELTDDRTIRTSNVNPSSFIERCLHEARPLCDIARSLPVVEIQATGGRPLQGPSALRDAQVTAAAPARSFWSHPQGTTLLMVTFEPVEEEVEPLGEVEEEPALWVRGETAAAFLHELQPCFDKRIVSCRTHSQYRGLKEGSSSLLLLCMHSVCHLHCSSGLQRSSQ